MARSSARRSIRRCLWRDRRVCRNAKASRFVSSRTYPCRRDRSANVAPRVRPRRPAGEAAVADASAFRHRPAVPVGWQGGHSDDAPRGTGMGDYRRYDIRDSTVAAVVAWRRPRARRDGEETKMSEELPRNREFASWQSYWAYSKTVRHERRYVWPSAVQDSRGGPTDGEEEGVADTEGHAVLPSSSRVEARRGGKGNIRSAPSSSGWVRAPS